MMDACMKKRAGLILRGTNTSKVYVQRDMAEVTMVMVWSRVEMK